MKKTIFFHSVFRIRQDYLTDDTEYGFTFYVVDSALVGEPEEMPNASHHKIKVGIAYEVLYNWRLTDSDESELVKVLFHYARRYVEEKTMEGTLREYEEFRLSLNEHREGYCPLNVSLIPDPIGFTTTVEVVDMKERKNGMQVLKAVMFTALPVEYKSVSAHLTDLKEETHPQGTVYERGKFLSAVRTWEVVLVEIGKGNPKAAREAERAIQHFQPDVVFFVGVAGGIKDVKLGDVVELTPMC